MHVERPAIFSYAIGAGALRNRENAALSEDPCAGNLRRGGVPYTGLTSDVAERVKWHNAGLNVHTAGNRPWSLIVSVEFTTEAEARRFERYLKSGSGRAFAKRHFP